MNTDQAVCASDQWSGDRRAFMLWAVACLEVLLFSFVSISVSMRGCVPVAMRKSAVRTTRALSMAVNSDATRSDHLFSVAPMMEYTDRHQRALQRIMSKKTVLYTEMVTTNAIVRSGTPERFLFANLNNEEPVVLQLGGSDPEQMKQASILAKEYGYQEINLNIGCPSEKVSGAGCFGAVLYHTPELVSQLAIAVGEATGKAATIKCRIGTDGHESYEELCNFIRSVSEKGKVTHFIIHARIAVLGAKFSPKDNRTIPPLKYNIVYDLIRDFPHLKFSLNGGVQSLEQVSDFLARDPRLHGVMVGRAVVNNPYAWSTVDSTLYNAQDPGLSRLEVLQRYAAYTTAEEQRLGTTKFIRTLTKPVLNLFAGVHHGKLFRQRLDANLNAGGMCASEALLRAAECFHGADESHSAAAASADTQIGNRSATVSAAVTPSAAAVQRRVSAERVKDSAAVGGEEVEGAEQLASATIGTRRR